MESVETLVTEEVTLEEKLNILADLKLMLMSKQQQFDYENSDLIYQIQDLEKLVKNEVWKKGETVKTDKITVSYSKGRETWDSKKLNDLAEFYPIIAECKKVGEPSVSVRLARPLD